MQAEKAGRMGGTPKGEKTDDGQGKEVGELLGHEEVSDPFVSSAT